MNIKQLAAAFVAGQCGACHNARVYTSDDGVAHYILHKSEIATRSADGSIVGNWCGYYSATTANHLSNIHRAANAPGCRPGYASARNERATTFKII